MTKKTKIFLFTLIGVGIILAGVLPKVLFTGEDLARTGSSGGGAEPLPVDALVLQARPLQQIIRTSGTLLPNEEVTLTSETAGKIVLIRFKEGTVVKKGELLVKINDAELQARRQKAGYDRQLAAEKEFRQREQLEASLISQETYDEALNVLNTIQADIELIQAQIAKTEIRAPFTGKIGLKYVSEGSYITTATPIANLISMNPIKIEFAVPEKYAGLVQVGDKISFTVTGTPSEFTARVYALEPRLDPATRTLPMRAITPNKSGELLPGFFAEVKLVVQELENSLMIPTEALIPELGGQKVFLYQSGAASPVAVETGIRTETSIQITKGLQPGDTLITSGILQMRPGLPIKISLSGDTP